MTRATVVQGRGAEASSRSVELGHPIRAGDALAVRLLDVEPVTPETVLRRFLESLSKNTLRAYERDLRALADWLLLPGTRSLARHLFEMSGAEANALALDWLNYMRGRKLAPATQARRLSALRSLVAMGQALGLVDWSIGIKHVRVKVQRYKDVRGPGVDAFRRMYDACGGGMIGTRDRAILALLTGLALRRGEVAALRRADYDRDRRLLSFTGKGEKDATVSVPPDVAELLDAWIDAAAIGDDEPIFHSLARKSRRTPLTGDAVWGIVARVGKHAGVRAWPHALRHTGVTTAAVETRDPFATREFARHESVNTTQQYIDTAMDKAGETARRVAAVLFAKDKT